MGDVSAGVTVDDAAASQDVSIGVVWFKRDLRVSDHAPLVQAARAGPVLALYVVEPSLLAQPETDASHLRFIAESLDELRAQLRVAGARLFVRTGEVVDVLDRLHRRLPLSRLHAHQETGNALTFARDVAVARFCRAHGIAFVEHWQHGVQRPLRSRDGWARTFVERMSTPTLAPPAHIDDAAALVGGDPFGDDHGDGALPVPEMVGLGPSTKPDAQRGGERQARATLKSFLAERCVDYRTAMSSPLSAEHACSRISPHLAYGTLSTRQAFAATAHALARAPAPSAGDPRRTSSTAARRALSLRSFQSRLFWQSHFMQKLESDTRLEFVDQHPGLSGLRESEPFDEHRFASWCRGETGFPIVDACMRMLLRTGWLNFRMRAMLVSVASYHLWLPWRRPALHLAKHFLDFEPGIHFPQVQMQSGTTGTNTLRIYSPLRQARVQDPTGAFIRRWVPELQAVPDAFIHAPHAMPALVQLSCGVVIGRDYPAPIVDEGEALACARERITAARRALGATAAGRAQTAALLARHGSRRPPPRRRARPAPVVSAQLSLSLGAPFAPLGQAADRDDDDGVTDDRDDRDDGDAGDDPIVLDGPDDATGASDA
jgi:deoxyribodipyrimidine photo-lyase